MTPGTHVQHTGSTTEPNGGEGKINAISSLSGERLHRIPDPSGIEHWFKAEGLRAA